MRTLAHVLLLGLLFALPAAGADLVGGLRVEGTRFVLPDEEGRLLTGGDLIGAELDIGPVGVIRIDAIERDSGARFDEVWLHTLQLRTPGSMVFSNFCTPDPYGDTRAVVYPGYFDEALRYVPDAARFSFSCVSGVEAKCLRWGYLPWRTAPNTGESLAPYYETCIRLARADYLGDNRPSTRDGTSIDVYDRVGVQQRTPGLDMRFEAGWNTSGAVCVHHTRIPANLTLAALRARRGGRALPGLGDTCNEHQAQADGALLYNRSRG